MSFVRAKRCGRSDAGSRLHRLVSCQCRSGVGLDIKRRGLELGVWVVTVLFVHSVL